MSNRPADKNRRVLVIDDNRSIHDDFRKILSPATAMAAASDATEAAVFGHPTDAVAPTQFEVASAYQGQEGVEQVKKALEAGRPYALAFVDVRMPPGWDGVETTRRIWELDPNLQVVLCTAYSDYSWDDLFEKLGHRDGLLILKKPFDSVEAIQLAHALTEKWWLHQQSRQKVDELESRVVERTRELQQTNQALQAEVVERKRADENKKRALLRQQGISQLQQLLLARAPLEDRLRKVTDAIVRLLDADFCRIWLIRPGDRCEQGCIHGATHEGPHVCRHRDRCLHLLASSGRYTHLDGRTHRRVPFGCYKIGHIAADEDRKFLTNDIAHESWVHDRAWARDLELVSFAGYQLRAPGGEALGVLALFAQHPILADEDAILDGLGSTVALVIQEAADEMALRESEKRFRYVLENVEDAIWSADLAGHFDYLSPIIAQIYGRPLSEMLTNPAFWIEATHPEDQATVRASNDVLFRDGHAELEYRIILPDGTARWIFDRKTLLRDEHGELSRMAGILSDITERKRIEAQRDQLIRELQNALLNVKSLSGLLPICAGCKKIRDDKGYWNQVDNYIQTHSEATFTHGMCPDCLQKWCPELEEADPVDPTQEAP